MRCIVESAVCVFGLCLALAAESAAAGVKGPWMEFPELEKSGACDKLVAAATTAAELAKPTWGATIFDGENPEPGQQERLDRLYACLRAGPIPNGMMNGTVVLAQGGNFDSFGKIAASLGFPVNKDLVKKFAETLWQGKHFYKAEGHLLNMMGPNVLPILGHPIAGQMRFPAKLFCGQSLLDSRRESIIIDYAFTDDIKEIEGKPAYDDNIDWIAGGTTKTGKAGLGVRDEMRMIHPGLYLGRAAMQRAFVLNFILQAPGNTPPDFGPDTCWNGEFK